VTLRYSRKAGHWVLPWAPLPRRSVRKKVVRAERVGHLVHRDAPLGVVEGGFRIHSAEHLRVVGPASGLAGIGAPLVDELVSGPHARLELPDVVAGLPGGRVGVTRQRAGGGIPAVVPVDPEAVPALTSRNAHSQVEMGVVVHPIQGGVHRRAAGEVHREGRR
jgi:hypothetical protein